MIVYVNWHETHPVPAFQCSGCSVIIGRSGVPSFHFWFSLFAPNVRLSCSRSSLEPMSKSRFPLFCSSILLGYSVPLFCPVVHFPIFAIPFRYPPFRSSLPLFHYRPTSLPRSTVPFPNSRVPFAHSTVPFPRSAIL